MKHPHIDLGPVSDAPIEICPSDLCHKDNFVQMEQQVMRSSSKSKQSFPNVKLSGGILVRASATGRILFGMAIIFSLFAIIVMRRIWTLEAKNELLEVQLNDYHDTLKQIMIHLPVQVPELENEVSMDSSEEADEDAGSDEVVRVRRDLTANITVSPRNESLEVGVSRLDETLNHKNRSGRKSKDNGHRDKGNSEGRVNILQKAKDSIKKLKLKLKLANTRRRTAAAHFTKLSSSRTFSDARAIYMIPVTPHVNIKKAEQLIGPWYIGEGSDFGFNDLWYRDVSLDENKTSIIFKKSGLHLIYAQVYYHQTLGIGERPAPMGYRIYIKKTNLNGQNPFRRPIAIAECVPSYPTTFYQTCFTQAAWFMEVGDQVYLEHFANSFPMIEADRQGKTFLGIVRLSSAQ